MDEREQTGMDEREQTGAGPTYDLSPTHTALIGVDFQHGFGSEAWEVVPLADQAVSNFGQLASAWRLAGGSVIHVHTTYTDEIEPSGNITDFAPDIKASLFEGTPGATFYTEVVDETDTLVRKTTFSAVASSDLLDVLRERGFDSAIVGGLTTPICVQTTVDALSMAGVNVAVLADATAAQAIGEFTAEQTHEMAITRMGYLFAQVMSVADVESVLMRAGDRASSKA